MRIAIALLVIAIVMLIAAYVKLSKVEDKIKCEKKSVKPELIATLTIKGETYPDFRCECGYGVADDYRYCPYCGAELKWEDMKGLIQHEETYF